MRCRVLRDSGRNRRSRQQHDLWQATGQRLAASHRRVPSPADFPASRFCFILFVAGLSVCTGSCGSPIARIMPRPVTALPTQSDNAALRHRHFGPSARFETHQTQPQDMDQCRARLSIRPFEGDSPAPGRTAVWVGVLKLSPSRCNEELPISVARGRRCSR